MEEYTIEIENLSKVYKLYNNKTDRLKEALSFTKKIYYKEYYALKDISFKVKKGETIGIIGSNGAGKSTLLKIITGVLNGSEGKINIKGRVSALLELGAGFNPEYTGIQNIYLNGSMMGYSKAETDKKLNDILEFADINDFINQPVKTYSSGMFARLAFAVAINVEPDILIVDEALSVGDIVFQQKCFRKISEIKNDKTILMVSHDMGTISKFCDKVLWLDKGTLKDFGEPSQIIKEYQAFLINSKLEREYDEEKSTKASHNNNVNLQMEKIKPGLQYYGNLDSEILEIGMFKADTNESIRIVMGGEMVELALKVRHKKVMSNIIIGFTFYNRLGENMFGINSYLSNDNLDGNENESIYKCRFRMPELNEGQYSISPAVAVGTQQSHTMIHWVYDALVFNVVTPFEQTLPGIIAIREFSFSKL